VKSSKGAQLLWHTDLISSGQQRQHQQQAVAVIKKAIAADASFPWEIMGGSYAKPLRAALSSRIPGIISNTSVSSLAAYSRSQSQRVSDCKRPNS